MCNDLKPQNTNSTDNSAADNISEQHAAAKLMPQKYGCLFHVLIAVAAIFFVCYWIIPNAERQDYSVEHQVSLLRKNLAYDAENGNLLHAWANEQVDALKDGGKYAAVQLSTLPHPLQPLLSWSKKPTVSLNYSNDDVCYCGNCADSNARCIRIRMAFYRELPSFGHLRQDGIYVTITSDYFNSPPPPAEAFLNAEVTGIYKYRRKIIFAPGIHIEYHAHYGFDDN